jgi:acetyl-CoA carboxylase carboxyltransferase component
MRGDNRIRGDYLCEVERGAIDVYRVASEVVIDEVVSPGDLRDETVARFDLYEDVEKDRPEKKHGTIL